MVESADAAQGFSGITPRSLTVDLAHLEGAAFQLADLVSVSVSFQDRPN
jgi:hypothetical protein